MCGLVSFLSLHPSNTASCLQEQPTPSASEAHRSCLEAGKQIPFYLPCKSTDVWNVSKCTQPSLGFRHGFSWDDLFGILIPNAFRADKFSMCSFRAASASLFQPMCHGQCMCVVTSALSQLPRPFARHLLISVWKILYLDIQMHGLAFFRSHLHLPVIIWGRKAALGRAGSGDLTWSWGPGWSWHSPLWASESPSLKPGGWNGSPLRPFCL